MQCNVMNALPNLGEAWTGMKQLDMGRWLQHYTLTLASVNGASDTASGQD